MYGIARRSIRSDDADDPSVNKPMKPPRQSRKLPSASDDGGGSATTNDSSKRPEDENTNSENEVGLYDHEKRLETFEEEIQRDSTKTQPPAINKLAASNPPKRKDYAGKAKKKSWNKLAKKKTSTLSLALAPTNSDLDAATRNAILDDDMLNKEKEAAAGRLAKAPPSQAPAFSVSDDYDPSERSRESFTIPQKHSPGVASLVPSSSSILSQHLMEQDDVEKAGKQQGRQQNDKAHYSVPDSDSDSDSTSKNLDSRPGAHHVGGFGSLHSFHSYNSSTQPSPMPSIANNNTENQHDHYDNGGTTLLAAEVVPDEEEIQERIEREAEARIRELVVSGEATLIKEEEGTMVMQDKTKTVMNVVKKRWCWLLVLLVVFVGAGAGAGIALSNSNSSKPMEVTAVPQTQSPTLSPTREFLKPTMPPTPEPRCSFCFNVGDTPSDQQSSFLHPLTNEIITCSAFLESQTTLPESSDDCPIGQALAWRYCGCPTLPLTIPDDNQCPLCLRELPPTTPGQECINENAYVAIIGSWAPETCPALVSEASTMCECLSEEDLRFSDFASLLSGVVLDPASFDDTTTHQYEALSWLMIDDPLALDVAFTPAREIQDRFIIVLLYFATNGRNWFRSGDINFLSDQHICNWNDSNRGVFCRVTMTPIIIDLVNLNMVGSIPFELVFLSSLEIIDFSSNFLVGSIPSSLGKVAALKSLTLEENSLTGLLPESLFLLAGFSTLRIDDNAISGSIPATFANATSLVTFEASSNSLTGEIPDFVGQSTVLDTFSVSTNSMTGTLPDFNPETVIQEFTVSVNMLDGTLPSSLMAATTLELAFLGGNLFSGSVPALAGSNGTLVGLYLWENDLTGSLDDLFLTAPATVYALQLSNNKFTGGIPTTIGNSIALEELSLAWNPLGGTIPSQVGLLTRLSSRLYLRGTQLSGSLPSEIGNLSLLREFFFNDNFITGIIPSEIGSMSSIRIFEGASNFVSGQIPEQISRCFGLASLGLFSNQLLRGNIDEILNFLPRGLVDLFLGDTNIRGTIPGTMNRFFRMETLVLVQNFISGPIPSVLGRVASLIRLEIWGNQLSGTIPTSLGGLRALTSLDLGANRLRGLLPASLSGMISLMQADFSENTLSGTPSALDNLSFLQILYLQDNNFEDVAGLCGRFPPWDRFAANVCGSTRITCTCCNYCCNLAGTRNEYPDCFAI